ncbi:uncharacterized protein LOC125179343 [Hyalella azteca]|uniref:sn-1-specific diacylglycerol lipase n=1 Tax=Hyalella azteca TaxID=294128 RepID=A0A979FUU1_HYAAZ|nr:uncharacterized protein LOC125179343 [Hyalella azteca]
MPALVFCKRRWRIGSDDFVLPGILEILIRIAWLLLVATLFIQHEQFHCSTGSTELRIYLIDLLTLTLDPRVVMAFPEMAWQLMGSIWIFSGQISCENDPVWIMLKALLVVTWCAIIFLLITIVLLFEPMARPTYPDGDDSDDALHHTNTTTYTHHAHVGTHYIQLWERRCRILCCASSKDETSLEALRNVADILASIFEDNDLVASDIVAALVLLRMRQKYAEKRIRREMSRMRGVRTRERLGELLGTLDIGGGREEIGGGREELGGGRRELEEGIEELEEGREEIEEERQGGREQEGGREERREQQQEGREEKQGEREQQKVEKSREQGGTEQQQGGEEEKQEARGQQEGPEQEGREQQGREGQQKSQQEGTKINGLGLRVGDISPEPEEIIDEISPTSGPNPKPHSSPHAPPSPSMREQKDTPQSYVSPREQKDTPQSYVSPREQKDTPQSYVSPPTSCIAPPPQPWMTVANAQHYMRFALASYGWPWYMYGRIFTTFGSLWPHLVCCATCCCRSDMYYMYGRIFTTFGSLWPHLVCCATCCCRETPESVYGDNCCLCHKAAMKTLTGLTDDDFCLVYHLNNIYEVPFYVAVDRASSSIIVAIRGTMSLKDTITDMTAMTAPVYTGGHAPHCLAHKGMVQAANFVYCKLRETQVLHRALAAHPTFRLVVTGHSLGAGAAVVLAAKLRQDQHKISTNLSSVSTNVTVVTAVPATSKSTSISTSQVFSTAISTPVEIICFAYSPPGGLCSQEFAAEMKDRVMSVVIGDDLVPRLSVHAMHALRGDIITVLEECDEPKFRLLARGCWFMLVGISEKRLHQRYADRSLYYGGGGGILSPTSPKNPRNYSTMEDSDIHTSTTASGFPTTTGTHNSPIQFTGDSGLVGTSLETSSMGLLGTSNTVSFAGPQPEGPHGTSSVGLLGTSNTVSFARPQPEGPQAPCPHPTSPRHTEVPLCLPGHVLHVQPSSYVTPGRWKVQWKPPCDFRSIIITPCMMRHHLPQEVMKAIDFVFEHNMVPEK